MVQETTSQITVRQTVQKRLDERIQRAGLLNIKFAPSKPELMHLIHFTSG